METSSLVKHANEDNFDAIVIRSIKPSLVDFWAPWCGPCRSIGPLLEDLANDYDGKANVVKVNVDENPGLAQKYGVRSIPMLIVVENGSVKETMVGSRPKGDLAAMIERSIKK